MRKREGRRKLRKEWAGRGRTREGEKGGGGGQVFTNFTNVLFGLFLLHLNLRHEKASLCGALSWVAGRLWLWNAHTSDVTDVVQ